MISNALNSTKINEFLESLMNLSYNQKCADCGRKRPSWASLTYSFFICYECSGKHRSLGMPKSKVKSTQMDQWSADDLRRMYIGGNRNAYKIQNSDDFRLKYEDCSGIVQELDELVKKSEKDEPGDSFMDPKKDLRTSLLGTASVKRKEKPRFSDIIEDTLLNEDILDQEDRNVRRSASNVDSILTTSEKDGPEEDHTPLHRVIKPTGSLKRSLDAARSPFSFTPEEIDDQDG